MKRFLILFIIAILFISGCQATPQETIVVNKGDNKLQETIQSAPVPTDQGTNTNQWIQALNGSKWTEDYSITNLDCDINAQITVPNTDAFPVYKVAKREFDSAIAGKLIKYFTSTATGVRKTSDTKEELEEQLVMAKKGVYIEDDNGGKWEPYDGQQKDIANLEEQIKKAQPEIFNPITNDSISLPVDNTYSMPNGSRIYIDASENEFSLTTDKFGILQPESWIINGGASPGEPEGTTLKNIKITENEAHNKVSTLVSDLGIKNIGISNTEKARLINNFTSETDTEGWYVTLSRNDGNSMPVYLDSSQLKGMLDFSSEDHFSETWFAETIQVFVDETGIRLFSWTSPLEMDGEINSNVSLLPFKDIKDRIKKSIEFGYSQRVQNRQVSGQHKIHIKDIILTNVLVPLKDDLNHQMLLPVWLVYYASSFEAGGKEYKDSTTVFALNAVDGSSIDLNVSPQESRSN